MAISKEGLASLVGKLKQERDELRLKIHLGTMEAKEEWSGLERKWETLETRLAEGNGEIAVAVRAGEYEDGSFHGDAPVWLAPM